MRKDITITIKVIHEKAKPMYYEQTGPQLDPRYSANDYRRKANELYRVAAEGEFSDCRDDIGDLLMDEYGVGSVRDIPNNQAKQFYCDAWAIMNEYYTIESPVDKYYELDDE